MASLQDLDARQRMINMMYIIFIAMLAMNMGKEVLQSFGDVNKSLKDNVAQAGSRNQSLMAGLAEKAKDQPDKYSDIHALALKLERDDDSLVNYIDRLKADLTKDVKKQDDGSWDYSSMDRDEAVNQMFFANDKLTDRAMELKNKIAEFRDNAIQLANAANNPALAKSINEKFNLDPVKTQDKTKQEWMRYNFEEFPLIASVTKLTNIQSNARQVQSELLSSLVSGQMESDVSMTNYTALVIPDKTAFFSGENFTGKVVLGRFDNTLNFDKVTVNGKQVTDIKGGQVMLDFPAGNVGEREIKGTLQFKEGDSIVPLDFHSTYSVIPEPNSAVISADKMNVVYRGVNNPMTISIPGVANVSASAPGLTHKSGASYVMNPSGIRAREVNIQVSGKLPNGKTITKSGKFRIKDIPAPKGTVRGQMGGSGPIRMQKNNLKVSSVGAVLPDFDFDLKLNVSSFKIQIPGKPIIPVNGARMSQAAKNAIDAAKRGSFVNIFDIKARIAGNSSYHVPNVDAVTVQLTN